MRQMKLAIAAIVAALGATVAITAQESSVPASRRTTAQPNQNSSAPALARALEIQARHAALTQRHPGIRTGTWEGSSRIYGNVFGHGKSPQATAESFRRNELPLLGVPADDLKPYANFLPGDYPTGNQVPLMYNPATGQYKFTAVYYTQERGGLEVYGSRLTLLVRNAPNFPLVMAAVDLRDLGDFQVSPNAAGRVNAGPALASARQILGKDAMILTEPRPVIWAGIGSDVVQPTVALEFNGEGGDPLLGNYQAYQFIADAATGAILHKETLVHDVDVVGNVSGMATTGTGADICGGIDLMPMPYARVAIGANFVFADANGNFTIPNAGSSPVVVDTEVRGQYFRVVNTTTPGGGNSTLSQTVTPPGPANFIFNDPNNPASAGQYKRAEVNAYVHANKVRDFVLQYNPAFPTISSETNFLVNVNINSTCNAFYSSANQSINFYISGGTNNCTNTANSTVVHHEFGHRIVNAAGSGQGQYGEGFGDTMGVLITDQPCLGGGFSPSIETTPCSSGFASCAGCLRTADNTSQYQTTGCSSCGSQIHACGRLISGCVWSVRNYLAATHPTTYRDIIGSLAVNSVLLHTGTGITPQITIDFLTLDDDDGNLANGTPHYNQINNGFTDHNMPGPPITAAIIVTPTAGPTHEGVVGGPYTNDPFNYSMQNNTNSPANYTVSVNPGGSAPLLLNGSSGPLTGTMAGQQVLNLAVSVDPAANSLPAGIYASTVQVQDHTNNVAYQMVHTLEIGQVAYTTAPAFGLVSGGPVGGPFTATQTYTVTSTKPSPVTVRVQAGANWISLNGGPGPVDLVLNGAGSSGNVVVGFSDAANSLPAGEVNSTVTFTNIGDGGSGSDAIRPVTLDVGRFTYAATDTPIPICDNCQNIISIINVPDSYCVGDVDVQVDITHTYVGDLIVEVINPQGQVVRLHNRTGGSADNIHKLYSDEGPNTPDGPGALSDFDGVVVSGQWKLRVSDNASADIGTIDSWQLKIASGGDVCPPVANDVTVTVPTLVTSNITLDVDSSVGNPNYIIMSLPANGTLFDPAGGTILSVPYTLANLGNIVRYKPDPTFAGPDAFTYRGYDGQDSNIANVNITVGGAQPVHVFPLDTNPGWVMTGPTTNGWAFGQPAGLSGDPANGKTGSNVIGYNLQGDYTNNMPEYTVTTGALNCANLSGVQAKFWRWLGVERSVYDFARFQVSNDGTNWTTIWTNPNNAAVNENAWSQQTYDISAVADGQASVYLRWTMGPTDGSVIYHGWNIDDVEVWGIRPPCPSDTNGDGLVNVSDLLNVINTWGPCPQGCLGDIAPPGGDGVVNVSDLLAVINGWGACP